VVVVSGWWGAKSFRSPKKSFFGTGFSEVIGFQQAKAVFRAQKPVVAGSVFF